MKNPSQPEMDCRDGDALECRSGHRCVGKAAGVGALASLLAADALTQRCSALAPESGGKDKGRAGIRLPMNATCGLKSALLSGRRLRRVPGDGTHNHFPQPSTTAPS